MRRRGEQQDRDGYRFHDGLISRPVVRQVNHNIRTWEREIREAQQKIAELTNKIAKAQGRFDKIRAGDWSVLSELKAKPGAEAEG